MIKFTAILLIILLLSNFLLVAAGRLFHCIKLVAFQGIIIGLLPLVIWNWSDGMPHTETFLISLINLLVKGILLPLLLSRAMLHTGVKRELEPFTGYSASLMITALWTALAFWGSFHWKIGTAAVSPLIAPVAFTTMFSGLFIIIARKKAITQVIGFLVFENAITIFGTGMMLEYGMLVELGILLDVLVLVFIMGIAVFQINREFLHIDSDKLNMLNDRSTTEKKVMEAEK